MHTEPQNLNHTATAASSSDAPHPSTPQNQTPGVPTAVLDPAPANPDVARLLNPQPTLGLQTTSPAAPTAIIDAKPVPVPAHPHKTRRKGRIASLPKLQRDMVSRMIWNGVPYKNIVLALAELGFNATERNLSNWATGGYLEWRFEQDLLLQNRLDQDHLTDYLRRTDASELPEVGLQAAATRLSQILLQKTARADDIEPNLPAYSQMIDILCRLNREISLLQKQRDDSHRSLGRAHDAARIKNDEEDGANELERFYSDPPPESGLAKPDVLPALPPVPTHSLLEDFDHEEEHARRMQGMDRIIAALRPRSPNETDSLHQSQ